MPNTKSAERRARANDKKRLLNRTVKGRVRKLEKEYVALTAAGKKEEAATLLRAVTSAYDKAVKSGVVKGRTADRKKSRLTLKLRKVGAPAPAAPAVVA